jgi:hypothetical protein
MNDEAMRYGTLKWLSDNAMTRDDVYELGVVEGFKILDFCPARPGRLALTS